MLVKKSKREVKEKNQDLLFHKGVSIIITVNDEVNSLKSLLKSFLKYNTHHPLEMIIIDHTTNNNLNEIINQYLSSVFFVHIEADPFTSYVTSNNFAAEKAAYPNLLFLKHDLVFKSDVLPKAVEISNDLSKQTGKKCFSLDQIGPLTPDGASLFCHRVIFEVAGGFSGGGDESLEKLFDSFCESVGGSIKNFFPHVRGQFNGLTSIYKAYNPSLPLISIHVPKTAGTSFRGVLKKWFKGNLLMYYPDISFQEVAHFSDLLPGQCLHGHFNRGKGFGIEQFVGENLQDKVNIITMLRNPFRMIVSLFLYYKYQAPDEVINNSILVDKRPQNFKKFFNGFLNSKHYLFSYLLKSTSLNANNLDQYIAQYTFIGIQEELEKSVLLLAGLLGEKPFKPLQKNTSDYSRDDILDLEGLAREVFVEEYRLYDRVKEIINLVQSGS